MECFICKNIIKEWRKKNNIHFFCSRDCYLKFRKVDIKEKQCLCCKKIFKPRFNKIKYCSPSCVSRIHGYQSGHKHSIEVIKKISNTKTILKFKDFLCKNCGSNFKAKENKKRIFCSKKCKNEMGGRLGISLSEESRKKLSFKYTGKGNPIWRGGLSGKRQKIYSGRKYRDWKTTIFERDLYTCQECKKNGCYLEAHHIIPWAENKDGWFDINNGITLCKECHTQKTREYLSVNWKNQYT